MEGPFLAFSYHNQYFFLSLLFSVLLSSLQRCECGSVSCISRNLKDRHINGVFSQTFSRSQLKHFQFLQSLVQSLTSFYTESTL